MVSTMSFFAVTRSNRAKPGALTHKLPRLARVRLTSAPWAARPWLARRRSESPSTHDLAGSMTMGITASTTTEVIAMTSSSDRCHTCEQSSQVAAPTAAAMTTMTGNAIRQRDQSCRRPTRSPHAWLYLACWNCSRHSRTMESFEGVDWGRPSTHNEPFCEHR